MAIGDLYIPKEDLTRCVDGFIPLGKQKYLRLDRTDKKFPDIIRMTKISGANALMMFFSVKTGKSLYDDMDE